MRGFGKLIGRALWYSSQQQRLIRPCVEQSLRLLHATSSSSSSAVTASYLDGQIASFSSNLAPLRSSPFGKRETKTMFIQTQSTPYPSSLMFHPGKPVMEVGSADFPNPRAAMNSPLAKALFGIDGITRVFSGSDFVMVRKSDDVSWEFLKPEILAAITDFFCSGQPLFLDSKTAAAMDVHRYR